jgi:7-cyano-7-deazaguanine synthase
MIRAKAVVLLSAGLDSTFNLYQASQKLDVALALTFNYGQKAAAKETAKAGNLAEQLGITHQVIDLPWFKDFTKTSLVGEQAIPRGEEIEIDSIAASLKSMKAVWVPNRNGIFLNIAAGFAEGLDAKYVVPGFNVEEAATFPDNSEAFLQSLNHAFRYSTNTGVEVKCFSTSLNKTQIIKESISLQIPLDKLWPCYQALARWCGVCESCQRFRRAAHEGGAEKLIAGCFL